MRIELSAIPQVIPTPGTDLREHTRTTPCMCHPRVVPTDNGIVLVHNSFDGREAYELDFSMNE